MEVFIGWSGDRSKAVAEGASRWLPKVIQAAEPWVSTEMERGANWIREVSQRLDASRVGIIVLTPDNLNERWILFESGALSKRFSADDKEHVCTLLVGVEPSQLEMPLSQFQATRANKEEIYKLVKTINSVLKEPEKPLPEGRLEEMFNVFWNELEKVIKDALAMPGRKEKPKRSMEDMLAELLTITRDQMGLLGSLNSRVNTLRAETQPPRWASIFGAQPASLLPASGIVSPAMRTALTNSLDDWFNTQPSSLSPEIVNAIADALMKRMNEEAKRRSENK